MCKKSKQNSAKSQFEIELENARQDYKNLYIGSEISWQELGYTGDASNCNPGTLNKAVYDKVLMRINYYRKICGLKNNVSWDENLHATTQKCASLMEANGQINHYPASTWKCYSEEAKVSAKNSNLAWGSYGSKSIDQWVRDAGSNNVNVGHRKWILYTQAKTMAFGCTNNYAALDVLSNYKYLEFSESNPEFIHYPAKFTPFDLNFDRWNFSYRYKAMSNFPDYTNTEIIITNEKNESIPLNIISRNSGNGDIAIVWEPDMSKFVIDANKGYSTYNVKVSKVKIGTEIKDFQYTVTIFL